MEKTTCITISIQVDAVVNNDYQEEPINTGEHPFPWPLHQVPTSPNCWPYFLKTASSPTQVHCQRLCVAGLLSWIWRHNGIRTSIMALALAAFWFARSRYATAHKGRGYLREREQCPGCGQ
jgi:hypothetical protein